MKCFKKNNKCFPITVLKNDVFEKIDMHEKSRMPESGSQQHLENKTSAAINCDVKENTADKMISASDQIARVKARRSCGDYEMEISGNHPTKSVCP